MKRVSERVGLGGVQMRNRPRCGTLWQDRWVRRCVRAAVANRIKKGMQPKMSVKRVQEWES